jgi:hypothetical protein
MHTGEELQQAHRRVVELLRQSRPQSPELVPAWSSAGSIGQPDPSLRYVDEAAIHHIKLGWITTGGDDLESDDVAISDWLGDCPQDILTNTAAKILGLARLEKLTDAAEAAGDQWLLARRAVLAADLARIASDTAAKLGWWRRALDALGELASGNASPDRQMQELMEMKVFCILSAASDPADAKYLPRVQYLLELEHTDSSPTQVLVQTVRGRAEDVCRCNQLPHRFHRADWVRIAWLSHSPGPTHAEFVCVYGCCFGDEPALVHG